MRGLIQHCFLHAVAVQPRTCPPATSTKSPWEVLESSARGQPKHQTAKLVRPPCYCTLAELHISGDPSFSWLCWAVIPHSMPQFPLPPLPNFLEGTLPCANTWHPLQDGFSLLQRRAFMENLKLGGVTAFKKKQGERVATAVCCPCPGIASGRGVFSRERPFGEHLD